MLNSKKAFTLIEVMVAVMIISVVIMALLQMNGNTAHLFSKFNSQLKINQYASLFIANKNYGFEKEDIKLDDLLIDFDVDDKLRRELKNIKVELIYEVLDNIDLSESEDATSSLIFETGKTILKVNDSSTALVRFRLQ